MGILIETVENVTSASFNLVATTTLACVLLVIGYFLRGKVAFLERFCIPAAVIGGFSFAILSFLLTMDGSRAIVLDTTLQAPLMIAFFTTVGLGGSFGLLKKGGKHLIFYMLICWSLPIIQNVIGVTLAKATGTDPIYGIMAGAVSMEGGHGAAASFGQLAVDLGHPSALTMGLAAATLGLVFGSMLGGPIANMLIKKNNIAIKTEDIGESYDEIVAKEQSGQAITGKSMLSTMALLGTIMVIGSYVPMLIGKLMNNAIEGFSLPGYVGAMIIAVIFRNLNDSLHLINVNSKCVDVISDISLGIFLTMAMMNLNLAQVRDLALPIIIIVSVQVVVLACMAIFLVFPILGKNYDAAVMVAGLMGHGLGATPNAMANMGSVCDTYKLRSNKAYLIVPICGAVLIDIVGLPVITMFINMFK